MTSPDQSSGKNWSTSQPVLLELRSSTQQTTHSSELTSKKRYDFKNFEISERKEIEPGKRVEIIFKLVYKSWNAGESPDRIPLTSTSNRATLDYDHGQWALSNVESLNTAMDWEVGLPMGDVSTNGVSPDDAPKEVDSSRDVNEEETQQNVPLENP